MKIHSVLSQKGTIVHTISPERSVRDAINELIHYNIGALLVVDNEIPIGIISERDVLRLTGKDPQMLDSVKIGSVMVTDLIIGNPDDDVEQLLAVMTKARVRHLPILDGDRLAGLISIGDLVKSQLDEREVIIRYLKDYITGNRVY